MVYTLEWIKPPAMILVQIHGYIDTDYSCQRNNQISPKFQIWVVQLIFTVHEKIVDKSMNKKFYFRGVKERSIVALVAEFTV